MLRLLFRQPARRIRALREAFAAGILLLTGPLLAESYVTRIDSREVFDRLTTPEGFREDLARTGKYLAPARDDPELLPTVYQNVNLFPRHLEFMSQVFPDRFPSLTPEEYEALVEKRATRRYWAGSIYEIVPREGDCRFGFTVFTDRREEAELPSLEEVASIADRLAKSFTLGSLCYVPESGLAMEKAREWTTAPFPIYFLEADDEIRYEAYTTGTAYGRVRLFTADEAETASAAGRLSWQDIIVIDENPDFLESVVSGIVTGSRQGELSHLNVRAARRGTPNVFVRDPRESFQPFEGDLVRIDFGPTGFEGPFPSTEEEAESWWEERRPRLDPPPAPDPDWLELTRLADMPREKDPALARFGAKAANLSLLNRCLPEEARLPGFAIPFHWYLEFIENNRIIDLRETPPRFITVKEYIDSLLEDPVFLSDSAERSRRLEILRSDLRSSTTVPAELVRSIADRIESVFGSRSVMVRFRSSSNMEDSLEFNGAGLYDSTSVCVLDSFDGDASGPSRCDAEQSSERTIERGLRKVWASLWNARAFDEREFFQLPHEQAAMAILVTPAFPREAANGVAFTGNPLDAGDKRYLVNVQLGDEDVVNPDPDILPEKDILEVVDGEVREIVRARPSSLVAPGAHVLSDDQLRELGATLHRVETCLPVDPGEHDPSRVVLDVEFKYTREGKLVLKQVRPFLIARPTEPGPTFRLVIPEPADLEGVPLALRRLDDEQRLLSTGRLRPGVYELPTGRGEFGADLIAELSIGAPAREAELQGPGVFRVVARETRGATTYHFTYRQLLEVEGEPHELVIEDLSFEDRDGRREIVFDERYLSFTGRFLGGLVMEAHPVGDPENFLRRIIFGAAGYPALPLYRVEIEGGGESVTLDYRLLRVLEPTATGPANLVRADVRLREGRREVDDYWRLVYRSDFHNILQGFRVLLDPPLGDAHAVEIHEPFTDGGIPPRGFVLDADLEVLRPLAIDRYEERLVEDPRRRPFLRGDADADGSLRIADAVAALHYLFRDLDLPCEDAADVDDNGGIELADAIVILRYLFLDGPPPAPPFPDCGFDPGDFERLECEVYPACAGGV